MYILRKIWVCYFGPPEITYMCLWSFNSLYCDETIPYANHNQNEYLTFSLCKGMALPYPQSPWGLYVHNLACPRWWKLCQLWRSSSSLCDPKIEINSDKNTLTLSGCQGLNNFNDEKTNNVYRLIFFKPCIGHSVYILIN